MNSISSDDLEQLLVKASKLLGKLIDEAESNA